MMRCASILAEEGPWPPGLSFSGYYTRAKPHHSKVAIGIPDFGVSLFSMLNILFIFKLQHLIICELIYSTLEVKGGGKSQFQVKSDTVKQQQKKIRHKTFHLRLNQKYTD